ncbi:Phosphatidylinositol 3-kinase VPS34 [Striga hermonthica]|uniref:Phosphatidylinositol 3-kinase VPS34 n=1 Tax=Striga hermonthica TaxID=68872 RepID=A0A9N7REM7_STRHE|nr:Phosphatidylinositol 3-kinase VPS34 [Striga hermonthica]
MSTLAKPNQSSLSSPWLMLPPAFDVDVIGSASMSYKFYRLADNKIVTLSTGKSSKERELTNPLIRFRGSSHGWLALYDHRSLDVFLYNPITGRHISLPPFRHFPDYPPSSKGLYKKVILSCSPGGSDCRAFMIYNSIAALAFCCPGFSKEWTRIGDHHWFDQDSGRAVSGGGYADCVYSTRHEALFCLTRRGVLESWDIREPQSPRAVKISDVNMSGGRLGFPRTGKKKLWVTSVPKENLVVAGEDLLVVTQHVVISFEFDGLYVDGNALYTYTEEHGLPAVTVDFDVHKYDPEDGELKYVEGSHLGGWALFVGFHSDAVALPAAEFPELKPNSIYFTDAMSDAFVEDCLTGGHDIGIFNYENKTVSPCYFPCDSKNMRKTYPAPMCQKWGLFIPAWGSRQDDSDCIGERKPELYVEGMLYVDGAPFGLPMRMRLESVGPSYCWNELVTLSTKYRDLTANSQLAVTESGANFLIPSPIASTNELVTVWDPELGKINPSEHKQLKLARSLNRGIIDRDLKSSSTERKSIQGILRYPPTRTLTGEEKQLLWKFRFSLMSEKRALTKLLRCVEWIEVQEAKQALELMSKWETIDV